MIKWIRALEAVFRRVNIVAGIVSSLLIFFVMVLTTSDVIGRELGEPIKGTYELTYMLLGVIVYFGVGYTHMQKGHISVDLLVNLMPERLRALVDFVMNAGMTAIIALMSWRMFVYASTIKNNITGELGMPVGLFVTICAWGVLLFAVSLFLDVVKSALKAVGKDV